jgi:hypothetical protein
VYEDNANRSFLIYLDESEAQDDRIMEYQRKLSAKKIDETQQQKIQKQLQNVQRILQPITVVNPYAEKLIIPKEVFKPRRTNAHYIAFIEAVTFYKQYQREHKVDKETGEISIETTLEDIAEANELMKNILLKKADELGYAGRKFLERVKEYLQANPSPFGGSRMGAFTNKQIREALREKPGTYKMYMAELVSYGFVRRKADSTGNQKKGFLYEVVSYEEYNKLQSTINTALDDILHKLQATETKRKK